jgi:hypothetical protein
MYEKTYFSGRKTICRGVNGSIRLRPFTGRTASCKKSDRDLEHVTSHSARFIIPNKRNGRFKILNPGIVLDIRGVPLNISLSTLVHLYSSGFRERE